MTAQKDGEEAGWIEEVRMMLSIASTSMLKFSWEVIISWIFTEIKKTGLLKKLKAAEHQQHENIWLAYSFSLMSSSATNVKFKVMV